MNGKLVAGLKAVVLGLISEFRKLNSEIRYRISDHR